MSKKTQPHVPTPNKPDSSQELESVSPEQELHLSRAEKVQKRVEIEAQFETYSGPLPHPAMLEKYETTLPGSADRIITMAEKNSAFLIDTDKEVVRGKLLERRLGQVFGFTLGLVGLGGSIWLASVGHDWAAVGIGGATLASIVSTFVVGQSKSKPREQEQSKPS